jgi:hypothetical protein
LVFVDLCTVHIGVPVSAGCFGRRLAWCCVRAPVFSTGRVRAAQPGLCGVHSAFSRLQRRGGSGLTHQPTGLVGSVLARGCSRTRSKLKVTSPSEAVGAHGEVAQEGRVRHAGGERTSGQPRTWRVATGQGAARHLFRGGVALGWGGLRVGFAAWEGLVGLRRSPTDGKGVFRVRSFAGVRCRLSLPPSLPPSLSPSLSLSLPLSLSLSLPLSAWELH